MRRAALLVIACVTLAVLASTAEASPRSDYMLHCMGCHLMTGEGLPPDIPPLDGDLGRILAVPGGRDYLIRVPGAAQSLMSDARLAEVINWMLNEFSIATLPDDFAPYDEAEVALHRPNAFIDPIAARAALFADY